MSRPKVAHIELLDECYIYQATGRKYLYHEPGFDMLDYHPAFYDFIILDYDFMNKHGIYVTSDVPESRKMLVEICFN